MGVENTDVMADGAAIERLQAEVQRLLEQQRLDRAEIEGLRAEIATGNARERALADVLHIVASSSDVPSALTGAVEHAMELCDADATSIWGLTEGKLVPRARRRRVSRDATSDLSDQAPPRAVTRRSAAACAILDRRTIHLDDVLSAAGGDFPDTQALHAESGFRTYLAVPLLRQGSPLGVLIAVRMIVRPFTDPQIALLESFANQAVIAIENVRLFGEVEQRNRELHEALEQQTATSEILRAIASSPTDLHGVIVTLSDALARLCNVDGASVHQEIDGRSALIGFGGTERYRDAVQDGLPRRPEPLPFDRHSITARAFLDRRTVAVPDVLAAHDEFPSSVQSARLIGYRAHAAAPLMHGGHAAIGIISLYCFEPCSFTPRQIALLEAFADQAVIAIQNARLFQQLQDRTVELTQSLEQQTALAEVLRVIASSPTDLPRVLDVLAAVVRRLCDADAASVSQFDGTFTYVRAVDLKDVSAFPEQPPNDSLPPRRLVPTRAGGRAILERRIVHIPDIEDVGAEYPHSLQAARRRGWRATVAAPLMRGDEVIGTLSLYGAEPRPFTEPQIALLEAFASQAAIAIANTQLFEQVQARTVELGEALDQQTALAEVLQVVSSSPGDLDPVFAAILERASRLCDGRLSALFLYDGERFTLVAAQGATPAYEAHFRDHPAEVGRWQFRPDGPWRPLHILDLRATRAFLDGDPVTVASAELGGMRTMLAVPLVKDGRFVGSLVVYRREVRAFSERHIELVQSFGGQAVIAMENARLFQELERRTSDLTQALEQQTATAEILRVIATSPTDVSTVLDTLVETAARLCDAPSGTLQQYRARDGRLCIRAAFGAVRDVILARWGGWPDDYFEQQDGVAVDRASATGRIGDFGGDMRGRSGVYRAADAPPVPVLFKGGAKGIFMSDARPSATSIDPREIDQFSRIAETWWNPRGPMATLHKFNPVRLGFVRERAAAHFQRDVKQLDALSGLRMLDIGCGGGLLSEPLARLGASVTGIDPLATNIDTARWHAEQSGVEVNYEAATSEDLVAAGRQFDVVLAMEVVEHVSDVETFMADIGSLVRPGGFVVLSTVSRTIASFMLAIVGAEYLLRWLPRGTHVWSRFITPSELAGRLRTAGLSPRSVTGVEYDPARREFRLGRDPGVNYMMSATAPRGRA